MGSPEEDAMAVAVCAQVAHIAESRAIDRTGWSRGQWVKDAERLMNDLHGSVLSLVNGHVNALLGEIRALYEIMDDAQRGALLEARNDLATYRDPDDLRNPGIEFTVEWLTDRAGEI